MKKFNNTYRPSEVKIVNRMMAESINRKTAIETGMYYADYKKLNDTDLAMSNMKSYNLDKWLSDNHDEFHNKTTGEHVDGHEDIMKELHRELFGFNPVY